MKNGARVKFDMVVVWAHVKTSTDCRMLEVGLQPLDTNVPDIYIYNVSLHIPVKMKRHQRTLKLARLS